MKGLLLLLAGGCCLPVFFGGLAAAAEDADTQVQVSRMLLARARDDYEIVAKARAVNRGLLERLEQNFQPFIERRGGELVYNFRKSVGGGMPPVVNELQELVDWHEKAVRRHFYLAEEGVRAGVKLNDALNRMEEFASGEPDNGDELEAE